MEGFREIENIIGNYVLPALVLFWAAVSFLISRISGWSLLARHYRMEDSFDGQRWRFQSCRMRWMTSYNNALTIGADRRGLYLSLVFLFRPGHPPLFIPWKDVVFAVKPGPAANMMEFRFRGEPAAVLHVNEKLGTAVLKARGPLMS